MKHHPSSANNTLSSTLPDTKLTEQVSQRTLNPTLSLSSFPRCIRQLFIHLKTTLPLRTSLLKRDVIHLYDTYRQTMQNIFDFQDPSELWSIMGDGSEKGQMRLFSRMVGIINKKRIEAQSSLHISKFEALNTAQKCLSEEIVDYEKALRELQKGRMLERRARERENSLTSFSHQEQKQLKQFQEITAEKQEHLHAQFRREAAQLEIDIQNKLKRNDHLLRPSIHLKNAKDVVFQAKLSPFQWEQKRRYSHQTYAQQLSQTVQFDQNRKINLISHLKSLEKQKLRRYNALKAQKVEAVIQSQRDKLHLTIEKEKQELQNAEEIKLQKQLKTADHIANHRLRHLRRSLNAYAMHQDSAKIRDIIQTHRAKVQFETDVRRVVSSNVKDMSARYCTINAERMEGNYERRQQLREQRLESKLTAGVIEDEERTMQHKRSLVDLYDSDMKLI